MQAAIVAKLALVHAGLCWRCTLSTLITQRYISLLIVIKVAVWPVLWFWRLSERVLGSLVPVGMTPAGGRGDG